MPTSTYHCVDVSSQIEERGNLAEGATTLNWIYYNEIRKMAMFGMSIKTTTVQTSFVSNDLSAELGYIRASLIVLIYGRLDLDNLMSQSQT